MIIKSGIIQGGPFSPPLFLVYLSYETIDGKRCLVMKFADDCGMLLSSPTAEGLRTLAENALKHFADWLKSKGMECAEHKSKFMLMFRTKKTAEKYFKNLIPPSEQNPDPLVQAMRILGLMVDSELTFREHVLNVCNSFRTRINSLRKLKKVGMGAELGLQFVVCCRSYLHFGLWWMCFLSASAWKELETVWNVARRTALHEKCSQTLKIEKLEEFTGLSSIRNFANYLMQLRSTKLLSFRKCERFTLSFEEIEKLKDEFDPTKHSISTVKRRDQTMAATTASVTDKRNQKMTTKYGSVKTYLFELALSRGWKSNAFKQTKVDLRKQYAIPRKSLKIEIQKMSKDVLLKLLNSFSKARTHFQISSSISLNQNKK